MADPSDLKQQRNRFLAFAFASADLLLEISDGGKIIYVLGASKGLTGIDEKSMENKNWLELFKPQEQAKIEELRDKITPGLRKGPFLIEPEHTPTGRKVLLSGIKIPDSHSFFIALSLSNEEACASIQSILDADFDDSLYNKNIPPEKKTEDIDTPQNIAPEPEDKDLDRPADIPPEEKTKDIDKPKSITPEDENKDIDHPTELPQEEGFDDSIYNKTQFLDEADAIFEFARTQDIETDLTVYDFGRSKTISEENWAEAIGEISRYLCSKSLNGHAAAELADGRYSLVHDTDVNLQEIKDYIIAVFKEKDTKAEDLNIQTHTLSTNAQGLSEEEREQAFYHSVNEIADADDISEIPDLSSGLKTLVTDNKSKIAKFTGYIDQVNFSFHFQPVAHLKNYELDHYEMLCRFDEGDTAEWIKFGEDVGLSPGLDLAVCERVCNHLTNKFGGTRTQYSMNISPLSVNNPSFAEKFFELLEKYKNLNERLTIEIRNARKITPSNELKNFLSQLRSLEFKITLDNLGADAQSIWLLDELPADVIKLDGSYTHKIMTSKHDISLVNNLIKACRQKGVKIIGKMIETAEQAAVLKALNIESGQGHYFGAAQTKPSYAPPKE